MVSLYYVLFWSKGKNHDFATEVGIDSTYLNDMNGDIENDDEIVFFEKNFGENKLFPGGSRCQFNKGKEIPTFVGWLEGGRMDGETLTEILRELDSLQLYNED